MSRGTAPVVLLAYQAHTFQTLHRDPRHSAVDDVGDSSILLEVHVEPVLMEVLGHHLTRLNDTALLGQVFLAKVLAEVELVRHAEEVGGFITYDFIRDFGVQVLADEPRGPVLLRGFHETGKDERHGCSVGDVLVLVGYNARAWLLLVSCDAAIRLTLMACDADAWAILSRYQGGVRGLPGPS